MVVNTRDLMNGIAVLTDDHNMRVTIKHSSKGALVCGAACFVGGVVAGPIGMAIGGTIGGIKAWHMSKGQFKSLAEVIRNDMTDRQREQLKVHIMAVASDFEVTDLAALLPMIMMNNTSIQAAVLKTVMTFVTNEMHLQIQS